MLSEGPRLGVFRCSVEMLRSSRGHRVHEYSAHPLAPLYQDEPGDTTESADFQLLGWKKRVLILMTQSLRKGPIADLLLYSSYRRKGMNTFVKSTRNT